MPRPFSLLEQRTDVIVGAARQGSTEIEWRYDEPRNFPRSLALHEPRTQEFVHDRLERSSAPAGLRLEPRSDIVVESESGPHCIKMLS